MTLLALFLSILVGTGFLSYGYSQAGFSALGRWWIVLGALWILTQWRKYYWFASLALLLIVIGAAYGVWQGYITTWMLLGALGGLLGWDLSDFARRLASASPNDDLSGIERLHLTRLGIVAALGVGLAFLSLTIHVNRLPFEVAVGLVLLAALGLARLIMGLRRV